MGGLVVMLIILYGIVVYWQSNRISEMPEDTPEQRKAKEWAWNNFYQDID